MSDRTPGGRRRVLATAATGVLAVASLGAVAAGIAGQTSPPQLVAAAPGPPAETPPPSIAPTSGAPAPTAPAVAQAPVAFEAEPVRGPVLPESPPVSLAIPAIDAASPALVSLGLDEHGAMEVPQDFDLAGWYRHGPTPGELGPAVLAGHVDSAKNGPAVFFRLAELAPGDEVLVGRGDGTTAVFTVERVEQYAKSAFPTLEVYGDLDHAGLRLITCGGSFDASTGHYRDNIVVYASLSGSR